MSHISVLLWASLFLILDNAYGYSPALSKMAESKRLMQPSTSISISSSSSNYGMDRSHFLKHAASIIAMTSVMSIQPPPSNAIEFVPASPYFSGTYQDAVEIMHVQRIAVDNIANVINDGNLDEAGFKVMQLSAQTRVAGKIILDTFQESISGNDSVILLRFLSCQKKFAVLLDLFDECESSLQFALKAKSGGVRAAAQIKSLGVVEEIKSAYDDFLQDLKTAENAIGK